MPTHPRPRRLARLARGALAALAALLAACPGPRAPGTAASCPEARRLLEESAAERAGGHLFRALARAETADRACASEVTHRAVDELREALLGRPGERAPGDAAVVRDAALARLAGDPAAALATLRPLAARLDAAGLAELARSAAAAGHAAEARAALEGAAARGERRGGRGRWRWQAAGPDRDARLLFTPDGARLAAADREGVIRIWDVAGGHEVAVLRAGGGPPSLAISPDGAWLSAAQAQGPVEVWDVTSGKRTLELAARAPVAFTPEGHLVAAAPGGGLIEVELPSGAVAARFGAGAGAMAGAMAGAGAGAGASAGASAGAGAGAGAGASAPRSLAIAGDRIYAAGADARPAAVVVWERGGGHRKLDERTLSGPVLAIAAAPGGELVALLRDRILVHERGGALRHTLAGAYASIALSPDGRRLLATTAGGDVALVHLDTDPPGPAGPPAPPPRRFQAGDGWVVAALHGRAPLLATASDDGISIWTLSGERTARLARPHAALAVAFDATGRRLAVGTAAGAAGDAAIWDLATGGLTAVSPRPGAPVTAVAFGPGGALATASVARRPAHGSAGAANTASAADRGSTLALWDARGTRRWSRELDRLAWIGFRPGTDALGAVSRLSGQGGHGLGLTLWGPGGEPLPLAQPLGPGARAAFAWTDGGARLAHVDAGGVRLAPLDGGRAAPLDGGAASAALVVPEPGGGRLAIAGDDGRISLWDAAARQPLRVLLHEGGEPAALAWSPAGVLASAGGPVVALWDPRTGARLAALAAHAAVTAIAFRPDGRLLAAACADGLVELWSIADATLVATLAAPGEGRGLVIAPGGAVDGVLSDEDPLRWVAGGAVLPGRAAWEREAVPGLLPARLARIPAEAAPRGGLPGAAPPPEPAACVLGPRPGESARLISASVRDGGAAASLCVLVEPGAPAAPRPPACFELDLASGAFRPRAPAPREALGHPVAEAGPSLLLGGARATVCRAGACRELAIPELPAGAGEEQGAAVSEDGGLIAAIVEQGDRRDNRSTGRAVVYEVATGRRLQELDVGPSHATLRFLGEALLVTTTLCAGPCMASRLVDVRTGRRLGAIGGAAAINTSELSPARVAGDVWAFNDAGTATLVYQDVRTGRVVRRFQRPPTCPPASYAGCEVRMRHAGDRLAIFGDHAHAGEVALLDVRGRLVAQHRAPACAP